MAKKKQTSTRNTVFNSYESTIGSDKYINSVTSVTATKSNPNIKLLNYNDYVKTTGKTIIDDAVKNITFKQYGDDISVNTDNLTAETDYYIYGSPHKMVLDNIQQYNNCGIDSTLNVLVMAGQKKITNQNSVETAFTKNLWNLGIADDDGKMGVFDFYDGATNPPRYKEILEYYGIDSAIYFPAEGADAPQVDALTAINSIRQGGAAIVGVSSALLWKGSKIATTNITIDHAITVTGVIYDTPTPTISTVPVGLYIHDTGGWITRYISWDEFLEVSLNSKTDLDGKTDVGIFATVVSDPIKQNTDNINATGTNDINIIYGNSGDNTIKGLGGDDILYGGAGNDKIYGGNGDDVIYGSSDLEPDAIGRNTLYGGNGNDKIYGGNYNDLIYGGSGDDEIYGNGGIDSIRGGSGNDHIEGGDGDDFLQGEAGNDEIHGGKGCDGIVGGAGNDNLYGGEGDDRIECGKGNDNVYYYRGDGYDIVKSSGGSVTLNLSGENSAVDELAYEINTKANLFKIGFYDDEGNIDPKDTIEYSGFYNKKTNKCQTAYLNDNTNTKYRMTINNAKGSIKVADTKGNNLLFVSNTNKNTITTGNYDDIVYMFGGDDTIKYTKGKDTYFSFAGNNTYISELTSESNLSIKDSTGKGSTVSTNDTLKLNTDSTGLSLFFDIKFGETLKTSDNVNMFILSSDVSEQTTTYRDIVLERDGGGFVSVYDYFSSDKDIESEDTHGNGYIETIQVKNGNSYVNYDAASRIDEICSAVQSWYTSYGEGYDNVYEAIADTENQHVAELIAAYTN